MKFAVSSRTLALLEREYLVVLNMDMQYAVEKQNLVVRKEGLLDHHHQ
jgi:hypothetical protein